MDQDNKQNTNDQVSGGGLPPLSGTNNVPVKPEVVKPEPVSPMSGEGLPPLETAEDETFDPESVKAEEVEEKPLPPLPDNEVKNTDDVLKEVKEIGEVNNENLETPPPPPPEELPVAPGKMNEKPMANERIYMGDGDGKEKKEKKKVNKKTIVGAVIALVLLVGVPVLALNLGYFRGDLRERAYVPVYDNQPSSSELTPTIAAVQTPEANSTNLTGTPTPSEPQASISDSQISEMIEAMESHSCLKKGSICFLNGREGDYHCCDGLVCENEGNDTGVEGVCKIPRSASMKSASACTTVSGGKCYTSYAARYQAQVDGCTNRTDLTCPEDGYACIVCDILPTATTKTSTSVNVADEYDAECLDAGGECYESPCEDINRTTVNGGRGCFDGYDYRWCCDGTTPVDIPVPTNNPTGTPVAGICVDIKVYTLQDSVWTETSAAEVGQYAAVGDTIRLALKGNSSAFVTGRFNVSVGGVAGSWVTTSSKNGNGELYLDYELVSGGSYSVEGEIRK